MVIIKGAYIYFEIGKAVVFFMVGVVSFVAKSSSSWLSADFCLDLIKVLRNKHLFFSLLLKKALK